MLIFIFSFLISNAAEPPPLTPCQECIVTYQACRETQYTEYPHKRPNPKAESQPSSKKYKVNKGPIKSNDDGYTEWAQTAKMEKPDFCNYQYFTCIKDNKCDVQ